MARAAATVRPGDLVRYRVMAYLTGVLLLLLVLVHVPLKYLADDESLAWVAIAHGWLYLLYVLAAGRLAYLMRWSLPRTLLVVLAGTVPFASFVAERKVVEDVRPAAAATGVAS